MSWEDIGFDFDRVGVKAYDDYNLPKLTVKTSASMASRIIRTDNPKPDYFFKQFIKNEQEKKKEPSDENRREHDLRNAAEDNCV